MEMDTQKSLEKAHNQIVAAFNKICTSYARVTRLSHNQKVAINILLERFTIRDFYMLFRKAENSKFLKGEKDIKWKATFDWIIAEKNAEKIKEGNYDDYKYKQFTPR